jgi:hypothetical protein
VLFAATLCVVIWIFSEIAAFFAYWVVDDESFAYARVFSEMRSRSRVEAPDRAWKPAEHQVLHPYLGYVYDPTQASPAADASFGAARLKSLWGFADSSPPLRRRASDRLIVGILGGSFARQFADVAPELLAEPLRAAGVLDGRELDVVRLAVNGYKQPQQLMTLSYLLALGAEFDVLLNIDGFNEVALHAPHNGTQGVFPAFPRAWRQRVQTIPDRAELRAMGAIAHGEARLASWAQLFVESPVRYSVLADFVWLVRDRVLLAEIARARTEYQAFVPRRLRFVETGPPRSYADEDEMYRDLAALWRESSKQLHRLARANDIQYFHFLQPNQYVAGSKPMAEPEAARALSDESPYREGAERGYPLLVREGRGLLDEGVAFSDLTGVFHEVEAPVYRDSCCHVNGLGNRIVARAIAAFVAERWVPAHE